MTSYPKTSKSKPPRSVLRRTLARRYGHIALPWAKLGFAVIPAALDGKNPAVKFSPWTTGKQTKPTRRIDYEQVVEWSDDHLGCNRGLLLLDSNPDLRLVVVDVDDPRWWPWVIATFGDTPYKVFSGRDVPEGSERPGHAYYLAPKGVYVPSRNGFIGPDEAFRWPDWPEADPKPPKHWGSTAIDVKAGGLYVVAPGSIHKTGREYAATVPMQEITPSFLASLPVFDAAKYEAMSAATKAEKRRHRVERLGLSTVPKAAKKVIRQHLAGEIDGDTVVHLTDGGTSTIGQVAAGLQPGGDTVSVFCPEHGNNETPAATVGRGFDGRAFLRCFGSCCTTFKVPRDNGIGLGFFGFDAKPKAEAEPVLGEDVRDAAPWVVPPLPSPAEAPVVLVATPMCSRKSTRIAEMLGQAHIKTALLVNPTIALAADGARKFQGKLYSTVDGKIVIDDVWVVCAPSLRRVSVYDKAGNYVRPDVLVIEEIEQTMGILHAASIMRHEGRDIRGMTYARLTRLCRSCIQGGGQVIALDANGSERAVNDLRRLTGKDATLIEAPGRATTVWTRQVERRFKHPADLLADLLVRADDPAARGIVYINSQIDLLAIEALLKTKGRTVLAIHGNATPGAKATLADVNTHWATDKADWVLYNDAAGSGVSCDVEGRHAYNFTRVWPGYTWAASIQGIGRARRPTSLSSWVEPKVIGWSVDKGEIRAALLRQVEDTLAMTYEEDEHGRPDPAPLDRSYFDSLADHYWITRLRGRNVAGGYYDVREQVYGIDVQDAPALADDARKAVMDAFNATRDAVKDKATDDVFDSIRIPDLDAEAFEKRADLTPEERAQLDKHTTLDRWGRDDRDLVEDTVVGRGRRWKQARSLVVGAAILLGLRGRVREAEKRRIEVEGKDGKQYAYKAQAGHDEARADEIVEILRLGNIGLDRITEAFRLPAPCQPWEPPQDCIIRRDGGFSTFGLVPSPGGPGCPQDAPSITTEPGHPVDTFWSDETLVSQGFTDAVRARAKRRDYGLLGIPTIPRDFDEAPSRWLGKVLAEWGIRTKPSRHPAGGIDPMTGNVTSEANDKALAQRASEAAWKREKRTAKKAGREPNESLRPPAKSSYRTIDWDAFAETATLVRRLNKKVQGHRVVSVEELAVLRLDPDEPELPDDLFDGAALTEPTADDECEAPPEAWAFIRDESRSLDERVRVVLASPSPPHVQRMLLAALRIDVDGLRIDAVPVVGGEPQGSPPCPSTPTPSPSPPPSV